MKIKSNIRDYEVNFTANFSFIEEINTIENKYIVVDKLVYELYKEKIFDMILDCEIVTIEALEENKNINTALDICRKMTALKAKRNVTLISFGGGIIQDITGFAANILYRGIKWIYVPTTLLAQTDSCIGGKTSLNFDEFKNLLGTFYPPEKIIIDTGFLSTLSKKDYFSGMGEIIKFNIMGGENFYKELEENFNSLIERKSEVTVEFINKSLQLKKKLIEEDEFDFGVRKLLNLGHTFGHALESISDFKIPHGQGVAFGLITAAEISYDRGLLSKDKYEWIIYAAKKVITEKIEDNYFEFIKLKKFLKNDKKREGNEVVCIIITDKNEAVISKIEEIELEKILMKVKLLLLNVEREKCM